MKKIISAIMVLCMLLCNLPYAFAEDIEEKAQYAEIVPGGKNTNISMFSNWGATIVEKDGKKAFLRTNDADSNRYMIVSVSDDFIYAPDGQPVVISVEYYDEGIGSFTITYDGTNNKQYANDVYQTSTEAVQLTDTKEWKTHEFHIPDCKFVNGYWLNSDFRIALWSTEMGHSKGNVYFGKIRIEKAVPKEPIVVKGTSEFYGNIFGPRDNKKLNVEMKNISEQTINGKFIGSILNSDEEVIDEIEFEGTIEGGDTYIKEVDVSKVTEFGLYKFKVSATFDYDLGDGVQEYQTEDSTEFSYINKPEKPNKRQYASTHASWYDFNSTAEVATYAGFAGVRDEIEWEYVEKTKGTFEVPEKYANYVDKVHFEDMEYLLILDFGNPYYDNEAVYHRGYAPYTDEGIAAYARYCAYMAEKYKGIINAFEIWNEYNLVGFNQRREDGATYARMLKAAYTAIKKVNPDATVVGMVTAGMDADFMRQVFENGGYDYMDALSYHWYDWTGRLRLNVLMDEAKKAQALLEEFGGQKPIWITENGSTSSTGRTGVGEEMQAAYAIQMNVVFLCENLAERVYWYDLQNDGVRLDEQEHCLGLVRALSYPKTPLAAKPSMVSMAGMNTFINEAVCTGAIKPDASRFSYLMEKPDGEQIISMWSVTEEATLGIDLGCGEIEIFDMFTNSVAKVKSDNGIYNFQLTKKPIYVKGNFTKYTEAEGSISLSEARVRAVPGDVKSVEIRDAERRNLTVEAEAQYGVTIVANEGIKNGSGTISFSVDQSAEIHKLPITVKDGDNILYVAEITVEVVEPITLKVNGSVQSSERDSDHWQTAVNIHNNSIQQSYSGVCEITNAEDDGKYSKPVKFFNLKPQEEITLYINLPPMVKKRIKDIEVELKTDNGLIATASDTLDLTSAQRAKEPPVIDGKPGNKEWSGYWLTADEERNVKEIINWGGPSDLSYDSKIMYDSDNFYMTAIVTDNVHYQTEKPSEIWKGDSLQFALKDYDKDLVVDGNQVDEDFTEVAIALTPQGPIAYRFLSMYSENPIGIIENADIKIIRENQKTIYEFAIPWSEIFYTGYSPDGKDNLGFSFLVNDNDGTGRRGWLEYKEGIGTTKNALLFGKLHLSE